MLSELREILAAEAGRPVRVETLARRLGTDPATVSAILAHAERRGLDLGLTDAGGCIAAPLCAIDKPACRRCPLVLGGRDQVIAGAPPAGGRGPAAGSGPRFPRRGGQR